MNKVMNRNLVFFIWNEYNFLMSYKKIATITYVGPIQTFSMQSIVPEYPTKQGDVK